MNPNYDADKMGWKTIYFSEPNMSYSFNDLCFWLTPKGLVFSASDSGCSCPSPFEGYEGETEADIEQKLERVGSFEQAQQIFKSWNESGYSNHPYLNSTEIVDDMKTLESWFK